MIRISAISLILSVYSSFSFSQVKKIDTDRPDQTESAVLVPKKWMQFETGLTRQQNKSGDLSFQHPTLLSKYGISKRFEFRLITTLVTNRYYNIAQVKQKQSGLKPAEIGAKVAFWEENGWIPKTSLIFHFAIPRWSSRELRADKLAPNFRFTMQNSFTDDVAIGYNLGAEWDGFSNQPTWIYTFAPGFNMGEKWYGYLEAFGFISKQNKAEHSLDAGIAYYITPDSKLDFSSGFGITSAAPDWYIALGWSVRFKITR